MTSTMSSTTIEHENSTQKCNYLLYAKLDNAKILFNLAKAVHFKDIAVCCILEDGLKISCEDSKCTQGTAFVHKDLFQEYNIKEECICIRININILVECLNLFGSTVNGISTALKICYEEYGAPLTLLYVQNIKQIIEYFLLNLRDLFNLRLEDNGVITECSIRTLEAEDLVNFEFDFDKVVNKIIIKSECLKEIISEIDTSNDLIEVIVSIEKQLLRISSFGLIGDSHIDLPSTSEYIETFDCKKTQMNRYKVNFIKNSLKALASSTKAAIRIAESGIMNIQFLIQLEESKVAFVEFYFCPDQEKD